MIVYDSNVKGFRADVRSNQIETKILKAFQEKLGRRTSAREIDSWKNSMMYMSNVLDDGEIPQDAGVAIEFMLPRSSKRVDLIITGQNAEKNHSLVIVELKQWTEVEKTDQPGVVKTFVGGAVREQAHPSYQAWSYAAYLEDFSEEVEVSKVRIAPCAYLHNCENDKALRDKFYTDDIAKAPVFIRSDADKLTDFIKKHVRYGDKDGLMYKIEKGEIKPTKKLASALSSMLNGKQEFIMIDDQKVVFEKAVKLANASTEDSKNVLIVNGGPGTGKSVVAVNLLVRFIQERKNAQYCSKNAAPREVYASKLTGTISRSRYKSLFVGSGSYNYVRKNSFDVLIVDEAHRLNEKSGLYSNLGENQIMEIIHTAKFSVFFLDENQRIALNDIGSKDEIYHWAAKIGATVTEMELSSQFRCNGSDGYLAWLDNYLQIRETANVDLKELNYDFRVFDSAYEMHKEITRIDNKKQLARTVAGYCWDWKSAGDPKAYDIELGKLKMRWNLKAHGSNWIIHPKSITEAGCIHTCQGLELDYIGVLVGPDLVVRDGKVVTNGLARPGRDKTIKGFRTLLKQDRELAEKRADEIIKNTYRTLMTRGMKGCYIHCTDKETNEYFKSIVGSS